MAANIELPIDADILKQLHENHYTVIDEFLREYALPNNIPLEIFCIFYDSHHVLIIYLLY